MLSHSAAAGPASDSSHCCSTGSPVSPNLFARFQLALLLSNAHVTWDSGSVKSSQISGEWESIDKSFVPSFLESTGVHVKEASEGPAVVECTTDQLIARTLMSPP